MGFLGNRTSAVAQYVSEVARYGLPEFTGPLDREVIFVLCGVGRSHFTGAVLRRALRREGTTDVGTVLYDWQFGLPGEIWTDLMWLRRNRVMGARLARRIIAFHRAHPGARIHVLAHSGGAGVAVFALESLHGRPLVETLVLSAPALRPTYNLAPALRTVRRAYGLVSPRDRFLLGIGTRIFGTTDRAFTAAAGYRGFRIPPNLTSEEDMLYSRFREIRWSPSFKQDGHHGGHTGWCDTTWLAKHVLPILRGETTLPTSVIDHG